jgi:predicted dinucleotide-binding enzyme
MAAAGNDRAAVGAVLQLIDTLGFDAVDAGRLEAGLALQPGGPVFGAGHSANELSNLLSRTTEIQPGPIQLSPASLS